MNSFVLRFKTFVWNLTLGPIQKLRYRFQLHFCPRTILDQKWEKAFGYPIDWEHPRDLNEKIQFLQVYTDTTQWSRLTDKVLVRDYVKECGLGSLLIPLLGVWTSAKDIDFERLPSKFILKCNHDSGSARIIDKTQSDIDYQKIKAYYSARVKQKYISQGEPHYRRIKPRILAETYLGDKAEPTLSAPVDYKVWCFNGRPYCVWVCYGRTPHQVFCNVYDLDWNCHPEYSREEGHYKIGDGHVAKPASLPEMLNAAEILSKGFPQVRVDFYDIDGTLYFGEMTFTSMCGRMTYLTPAFLKKMGDCVELPEIRPSLRNRFKCFVKR